MARCSGSGGQIIAAFGRGYLVQLDDGNILECVNRGKKGGLACGDRVDAAATGGGRGVIEAVAPRSSLVYRSDPYREKLIAANVDQVAVVVAGWPPFNEELLNRCLVAAEWQRLRALILLNKADLEEPTRKAAATLGLYRDLGYAVVPLCAKQDISALLPHLAGRSSVLVGQSGMGKSTLINSLAPGARAATAEISAALGSGRHTTTHARLYRLDSRSCIIDSPGMQEFGLHHLGEAEMAGAFPEFSSFFGQCRFNDCRHVTEPGCAIAGAVNDGSVSSRRLAFYRAMLPMARDGARGRR